MTRPTYPAHLPEGTTPPSASGVEQEDAAWTGNLLIIDGNQLLEELQAIGYVMVLAKIKPWSTEESDECVLPLCLPLSFAGIRMICWMSNQ